MRAEYTRVEDMRAEYTRVEDMRADDTRVEDTRAEDIRAEKQRWEHGGVSRVLHAFWLKGRGGGGGILKSRRGIPFFLTNNMVFLECGDLALFEAFYVFRDHNHVKMKF